MSSETSTPTIPPPLSPQSQTVADNLKKINNQIRAKIVSDALKKSAIGAVAGAAFSFLIFRRKQYPTLLYGLTFLLR